MNIKQTQIEAIARRAEDDAVVDAAVAAVESVRRRLDDVASNLSALQGRLAASATPTSAGEASGLSEALRHLRAADTSVIHAQIEARPLGRRRDR